jgi:hypothetical protein
VGAADQPAYPPLLGAAGTCPVTAGAGCSWTAATSQPWINITGGSGTGNGSISFSLDSNSLQPARTGQIFLTQNTAARCTINQSGGILAREDATTLTWTSELDVEGGKGQVVVDGAVATFQARGRHQGNFEEGRAVHRVEATLVDGHGRPGTWRFRLSGPMVPGSLRVIAGKVVALGADEVVFRVAGTPGERVLWAFRRP